VRLFVAVDPSAAVRLRLTDAIDRLRPRAPSARWVAPSSLHVTLAFLGEVEPAWIPRISGALESVALHQRPFEIHAAGLGTFGPPGRPRVLWASIAPRADDALARLHAATATALAPLGYAPEERAFTPHITLAHAGAPHGDPGLAACAADPREDYGTTPSTSLVVYSSEPGARYGVIAILPYGYQNSSS
jgi:RNA 2',3'-cyclic 3'-phosphodiesterase